MQWLLLAFNLLEVVIAVCILVISQVAKSLYYDLQRDKLLQVKIVEAVLNLMCMLKVPMV